MVAPGAWRWPAGVVPAVCRGLALLPGVSGAQVVVAAGRLAATVGSRCCRLGSGAGWGAAG